MRRIFIPATLWPLPRPVRDAAELESLGFPVFSRNNSIPGTRKDFRGVFGGPISVGGVMIRPGDLIVGDIDGVIALPSSDVDAILDQADARVAHETELIARLRVGRTTLELYGFDEAGR
jgi:4-hydroxy-4-methyl-2-oxoglutarate aldolase